MKKQTTNTISEKKITTMNDIVDLIGNANTYQHSSDSHETFNMPSLTQPDEAYTIRELIEKHTQGIIPNIQQEGTYQEDADFDNMEPQRATNFDRVDATNLLDEIEDRKVANKKIQEEKISSEKLAKEAAKKEDLESKEEHATTPAKVLDPSPPSGK